jgi:hypothetical protein
MVLYRVRITLSDASPTRMRAKINDGQYRESIRRSFVALLSRALVRMSYPVSQKHDRKNAHYLHVF